MDTPQVTPPTPRQALIARGEQWVLVVLALALVAGIAYQAITYLRVGAEPLEVRPPAGGPSYRINVNTSDWVTLSMVPGVGETLARRIVEVRDTRPEKRFRSLEDLKEVRGIADKTLAKLRPYLFLSDATGDEEPVQLLDGAPLREPPPRP
jgi:competence protein ComEA